MCIEQGSQGRGIFYHAFSIKGLFVLLLLSPVWFLIIDRYYGVYVAKQMCATDGGERIFESTYVPGYLMIKEWANGYCGQCMADLPAHNFEYMDEYLPNGSVYRGMQEPGYYRFTLGTLDDLRCETWENNAQYKSVKKSYPFKQNECLAVELVDGAASNHSWRIDREILPIAGGLFFVERRDQVVYEIDSSKVLSRLREYSYLSRSTRFIETALSGSANADVRCPGYLNITDLLQKTLRDPQKRSPTR